MKDVILQMGIEKAINLLKVAYPSGRIEPEDLLNYLQITEDKFEELIRFNQWDKILYCARARQFTKIPNLNY